MKEETSVRQRFKAHGPALGRIAKVLLSVGLVAVLLHGLEWNRLAGSLAAADAVHIAWAAVLLALTLPIAAARWRLSAIAVGISLPYRFFLGATYAAAFAGQFLPAGVGVDAARLGFLWHRQLPLRAAVQSVVVDRVVGVAAIFLIMLCGLPFLLGRLPAQTVLPVSGAAVLLLAGLVGVLFLDRLPLPGGLRSGWVQRLVGLVAQTRRSLGSRPAAGALANSLAIHMVSVSAVLLIAGAFGVPLHAVELLSIVSFAIFAALLPVSLNGWGVREGAMVLGLSLLGVDRQTAVVISLLFGVGSALVALPGALSWHRMSQAA